MHAEALYHKKSGARTSVVLTFDGVRPPATRSSTKLGATLNAVVHTPEASGEYSKMVWKRDGAGNVQTAHGAALKSR